MLKPDCLKALAQSFVTLLGMVTEVNPFVFLKANSPMDVTPLGIFTVCKSKHL
jgi:hypothetical protein